MSITNVLDQFALSEKDFLGAGGESRVYALPENKVLRVFGAGTKPAKPQRLKAFYDALSAHDLPFALPTMLEIGEIADHQYSLEPRIPGTNLTSVLKTLSGSARLRVLKAYLDAAYSLRTISFEADYYGEVLEAKPLRTSSWAAFLQNRAAQTLETSRDDLREVIPHLDALLVRWHKRLESLANDQHLVHGDFFPGNVMALESGQITAIIDFSPMTVVGDWRMDLAGALIFLEVTNAYRAEDSAVAKQYVDELLGYDAAQLIDLYRCYYALYFSAAKTDDPALYAWCVDTLKRLS